MRSLPIRPRLRRARLRPWSNAALGLAASLALALAPVSVAAAEIDALKAAFVFNFAKFTTWPAGKAPEQHIRLCFQRGSLAPEIFAGWEEKRIHDAAVRTNLVRLPSDRIDRCHVLYLKMTASAWPIPKLRELAARHHVLLVSDTGNFAQRGGHITLVQAGQRLRFRVNRQSVEDAGLTLSSQMLRLAEIVGDR